MPSRGPALESRQFVGRRLGRILLFGFGLLGALQFGLGGFRPRHIPQSATEPPQRTPEQPNFAEAVAQYVALGSGFAAPPVDTNVSDYNWTAPFRERVGSCSKKPEGVEPSDKVTIKIRISFKRDGTVAALPRLLVPAPSAKQQALMDSAVDALERCQPFTMLPPERYKQWKTMEVYVTPLFAHW